MARTTFIVGGGGVPAESSNCPSGTWTYAYTGDYPSDTDAACDSAGGKLDGTISGATVSSSYVLIEAANQYLQHSIDSTEFSTSAGTIFFSVYPVDADSDGVTEACQIFEIAVSVWDTNNNMFIEIAGDGAGAGRLNAGYKGNGQSETVVTAVNSISAGAWYRVGYSWQMAAGNDHAISIVACGGGGTQADCAGKGGWVTGLVEVDDDHAEMTAQPTVIRIGELAANMTMTDDVRVADFYIISGYKSADPF